MVSLGTMPPTTALFFIYINNPVKGVGRDFVPDLTGLVPRASGHQAATGKAGDDETGVPWDHATISRAVGLSERAGDALHRCRLGTPGDPNPT
jgi:hypothetical protein